MDRYLRSLNLLPAGIEKWFKVIDLHLKGKFSLYPKWGKRGILGLKIIVFELFFKSVYQVFLKLMSGIKNLFKITVLDFERKLIVSSIFGKLVKCLNRGSFLTSYML